MGTTAPLDKSHYITLDFALGDAPLLEGIRRRFKLEGFALSKKEEASAEAHPEPDLLPTPESGQTPGQHAVTDLTLTPCKVVACLNLPWADPDPKSTLFTSLARRQSLTAHVRAQGTYKYRELFCATRHGDHAWFLLLKLLERPETPTSEQMREDWDREVLGLVPFKLGSGTDGLEHIE